MHHNIQDNYNDDGDDYYQRYLDDYYLDSLQGQGLAASGQGLGSTQGQGLGVTASGQGLGPDTVSGEENTSEPRLDQGFAAGPGLDVKEGSDQELQRAKQKVARMILQLNLDRAQGQGLASVPAQGLGLGLTQEQGGIESRLSSGEDGINAIGGGGVSAVGGGGVSTSGGGGMVPSFLWDPVDDMGESENDEIFGLVESDNINAPDDESVGDSGGGNGVIGGSDSDSSSEGNDRSGGNTPSINLSRIVLVNQVVLRASS